MSPRMRFTLVPALLVVVAGSLHSQFSGYVSGTYGFHQNPMYNFERLGDQVKQSYTEINYDDNGETAGMKFGYVSGLMIFNRFAERNYYEHALSANYSRAFLSGETARQNENDFAAESDENGIPLDSSGTHLLVGLKVSARHDKESYKEFDNLGSTFIGSFRVGVGDKAVVRITNVLEYRRYVYLAELSNMTEVLSLQLGVSPGTALDYGLRIGGGVKHFTTSVYDTAKFEAVRTYTEKPGGKGKGGAKLKVPSSKQLLINPGSDNIFQFTAGAYVLTRWENGSLGTELLYRRNPGRPSRYLAQYVNTSILNEDIYNDHFSYEGPEARLRCTQRVPLGLQSIVTIAHQRKRFGAPAVNLLGTEVAGDRIDLRSSIELYLSKYVDLTEALGLDIAISAEVVRNQSNDEYNDYALFQFSVSVGIGF